MLGKAAAVALVLLTPAMAARHQGKPPHPTDFTARWLATAMRKSVNPGGETRAKLFQRVVWLGEWAMPIGTISYFSVPKRAGAPADEYSPEAVARRIGKPMGIQEWRRRTVGKADVYEAHWEKGDRLLRFYFDQTGDRFSLSLGIYRMAFIDSVVLESELIQRRLADVLDEKAPWIEWLQSRTRGWALVPEAYAEPGAPGGGGGGPAGPAPCPPCGPGATPWAAMACAACNQTQIMQQINQLNVTLGQANSHAAGANANWAASNARWGDTNTQFASLNQNWARSNELLERAMSPGNAFVLGLSAGAGAAAGAALIGLLATGFSELAKGIYEAVTHEGRDAELLRKFDEAMTTYAKLVPEIRKTELYIDSGLATLRMFREAGGREALLMHFNERIRFAQTMSQRSRELEIAAVTAGVDGACQAQLSREGARFDALIRELTRLRDRVEPLSQDSICAELDEQIRSILMGEQAIAEAAARILDPMTDRVVMAAHDRTYREAMQSAARSNNPRELERTRDAELAAAEQNFEAGIRAVPGLARKMGQAYDRCISDLTHSASPVTGFFAQWPVIGAAVQNATTVRLGNTTRSIVPYCREQARTPQSRYAEDYRNDLEPLVNVRSARRSAARSHYDRAIASSQVVMDPSTHLAKRGAHMDFQERLRTRQSQRQAQEERIDALLAKQGDIRNLCPSLRRE
jgi:hypothetical protein